MQGVKPEIDKMWVDLTDFFLKANKERMLMGLENEFYTCGSMGL